MNCPKLLQDLFSWVVTGNTEPIAVYEHFGLFYTYSAFCLFFPSYVHHVTLFIIREQGLCRGCKGKMVSKEAPVPKGVGVQLSLQKEWHIPGLLHVPPTSRDTQHFQSALHDSFTGSPSLSAWRSFQGNSASLASWRYNHTALASWMQRGHNTALHQTHKLQFNPAAY